LYNYCKSLFILILYRNPFLSLIVTCNYLVASVTRDVASKFAIVVMKVISHIQQYTSNTGLSKSLAVF